MNATKFLISTAAAVTVAGAIGLAYAQTNTYNNSAGTPGAIANPQTQTTTTGQTPADIRGTQNQQQNPAPNSMSTDPSGTNTGATKAGAMAPASTGNANSGATANPTPTTAPMTNDGSSNVRRNPGTPSAGMTTERDARPDRN